MNAEFLPYSQIPPEALTGLWQGTAWTGEDFPSFCTRLATGDLQCYVVGAKTARVYLVVSLIESFGERTVWLETVFAVNGGWQLRTFIRFLKDLAEAWECSAVRTSAADPRLAKALKKLGAKPEYVVMKLETPHGR